MSKDNRKNYMYNWSWSLGHMYLFILSDILSTKGELREN